MTRPQASVPARAKGSRSASATQRGPQKRGERTRKRILEAAEVLFAERGYADTSLETIAERVGIHQPGIFYYFPDKWALYEAVIDDAVEAVSQNRAAALTSSASPEERLLTWASDGIDLLVARPTLANLLLRESANPDPSTMPRAIPEEGRRSQVLMEQLLREIQPNVHPDDVFHVQSALTGTQLFYAIGLQRLMSTEGDSASALLHSTERHKKLLRTSLRAVLKQIRTDRS